MNGENQEMCDLEAERQILGAALYAEHNTEVAHMVADIPPTRSTRPRISCCTPPWSTCCARQDQPTRR